ncbi:phosphotransferase [Gordonia sp. SID5947]|uniref:phosphotransferase n=1 Tax=Gordonia sp. SID5947 TaxID=2690315 RepID=UPI00136EC4F4|nr:phosphotransferase [Gordonia sp. SID5947]MYR08573.1 phosphotransferase [Gordonia sp. SID5947]
MASPTAGALMGMGVGIVEATRAALDRAVPSRAGIPLRIDDVTTSWLAGALGLPSAAITSIDVLDHDSGTAARARLSVTSETDLPATLFVKLPPRNYLQHVLMNVFRLGTREVFAYRALGDNPPVRIPRCHVAQSDRHRQRSVLVLEDLSGTAEFRTCVDSVSRTEAQAVVDALADLHGTFWETERFESNLQPLTHRSASEIRIADLVRRRFLADITGHAADLIPGEIKRRCRMFYERSGDIDAFWAGQPRTFTHGDPHLGNVFFEMGAPGFLDWQIASAGVGIRDVAYFATASVEPRLLRDIERGLVERYVGRLAAMGVDLDPDRMWTLYRAAITEMFLAAVCTAEAGERMQPFDVSRVGVERAVAGVTAHDSFAVLEDLICQGC